LRRPHHLKDSIAGGKGVRGDGGEKGRQRKKRGEKRGRGGKNVNSAIVEENVSQPHAVGKSTEGLKRDRKNYDHKKGGPGGDCP